MSRITLSLFTHQTHVSGVLCLIFLGPLACHASPLSATECIPSLTVPYVLYLVLGSLSCRARNDCGAVWGIVDRRQSNLRMQR